MIEQLQYIPVRGSWQHSVVFFAEDDMSYRAEHQGLGYWHVAQRPEATAKEMVFYEVITSKQNGVEEGDNEILKEIYEKWKSAKGAK